MRFFVGSLRVSGARVVQALQVVSNPPPPFLGKIGGKDRPRPAFFADLRVWGLGFRVYGLWFKV
jgi:hypothetical protein